MDSLLAQCGLALIWALCWDNSLEVRFSLDKAKNAPPLRQQSTGLQLHLEFEVDYRVEWKELGNKGVHRESSRGSIGDQ